MCAPTLHPALSRLIGRGKWGALLLCAILCQSCFTGVESTPKITYREVKENNAETSGPEKEMAATFRAEPFADWKPGKKFYVSSPRVSLVLTPSNPDSPGSDLAEGSLLTYEGQRTVTDFSGKEVVELLFNDGWVYRTNLDTHEIAHRHRLEIPFTIELSLVEKVASSLRGKELYVLTPQWYTPDGKAVRGLKFVPVKVTDVLPANDFYPLKVLFTDEGGNPRAVYMTAGEGGRWEPRELPATFSFSDPRLRYPQITDATWQSIRASRPAKGMTKNEATLAMGTPVNIDRGHNHASAYERWSYSDGVYLIFEDGLLVRFNN